MIVSNHNSKPESSEIQFPMILTMMLLYIAASAIKIELQFLNGHVECRTFSNPVTIQSIKKTLPGDALFYQLILPGFDQPANGYHIIDEDISVQVIYTVPKIIFKSTRTQPICLYDVDFPITFGEVLKILPHLRISEILVVMPETNKSLWDYEILHEKNEPWVIVKRGKWHPNCPLGEGYVNFRRLGYIWYKSAEGYFLWSHPDTGKWFVHPSFNEFKAAGCEMFQDPHNGKHWWWHPQTEDWAYVIE